VAHAYPTTTTPDTTGRAPADASEPEDALAEQLFEAFLQTVAQRNGGDVPGLRDWVDLAEAWRIVHALRRCGGNRSAAARELGIGRRTLYTKMEKLGIEETFQLSAGWRR